MSDYMTFLDDLKEGYYKVKDDEWIDYLHDFAMDKAEVIAFIERFEKLEALVLLTDELSRLAIKAHKELEDGYETCGLIVDMRNLAIRYRVARDGK